MVPLKAVPIFFIVVLLYAKAAFSQCNVPVSTFPYRENFETDNGGWFSGGTNSDWAWGIPAKTNITIAGTGTKCWMTGGLAGNSYTGAQKSWLESPCFDLSALSNPMIHFKIFWDTERNFDGVGFQYTINNGLSWQSLGTAGSPVNCLTANWYNDGGIVYLGAPGWSGNTQPSMGSCIGGFGSWGWLVAQHDLSVLAGQPQVIFRFTFGSGTACNAYNGVAIDDINITQAAPGLSNFVYSCGTNRSVSFLDSSSLCATGFLWNFDDPASGANNTSTLKDPMHIFSAAGPYTVSQTVFFSSGMQSVITRTITILDATLTQTSIKCFGDNNGSATAGITGGSGAYTYQWNTNPVQTTPTISNLEPGAYIVHMGAPNACSIKDTAVIIEPPPLKLSVQNIPEKCDNKKGSLTAGITGGTVPYSYVWSNGGSSAAINNLPAGTYSLHVTDANGCEIDSNNMIIVNQVNTTRAFLVPDTTICPGEKLSLSPGSFSTYVWQDNSTAPEFEVLQTGTYSVTVTDADGCTSNDAVYVEVICPDIFFPTGFTPNNDNKNDGFGPGGKLSAVKNYQVHIYSRFGDIVFHSQSPYLQWDGKIKGLPAASGTYVWVALYEISGRKKMQQGTIVLLK